jgi:6-pyruvoyltetrahydropterin/6-carboxytetrahydropterin synthase
MSERFQIYQEFSFRATHSLPHVSTEHQCARAYGHAFKVKIVLEGALGAESGWVLDFAEIEQTWMGLFEQLNAHHLNDVPGLENPTSEMIAQWIGRQMLLMIPTVRSVEVKETDSVGAIWYKD